MKLPPAIRVHRPPHQRCSRASRSQCGGLAYVSGDVSNAAFSFVIFTGCVMSKCAATSTTWATFRANSERLLVLQSNEVLQAKLLQAAEAERLHHHREVQGKEWSRVSANVERAMSRRNRDPASRRRLKSPQELVLDSRLAKLAAEQEKGMAALPEHVQKLIHGYELRCYHFEIFESFRKLALVGVPVFFEPAGGVAQLTFALIVCFVTFGMYTALSPYVDDGEDHLAQLCQAQIFFVLLASIVLHYDKETTGSMDVLLTVMTFVPATLALVLESPAADHLTSEGMASAASAVSSATRRLLARMRPLRRSPATSLPDGQSLPLGQSSAHAQQTLHAASARAKNDDTAQLQPDSQTIHDALPSMLPAREKPPSTRRSRVPASAPQASALPALPEEEAASPPLSERGVARLSKELADSAISRALASRARGGGGRGRGAGRTRTVIQSAVALHRLAPAPPERGQQERWSRDGVAASCGDGVDGGAGVRV